MNQKIQHIKIMTKYISKETYKHCFKKKNFEKMCNMLDYMYLNTNKSWDEIYGGNENCNW